jgi:hypothetical protein
LHIQKNKETGSHSNGQAKNIDAGENFMFPYIPESYFKIIPEHDSEDLMDWQDGLIGILGIHSFKIF